MKPISITQITFERITLHKIEGYWTELRVLPDSVPSKFSVFECRDTDDLSCEPAEITKHVLVNFLGTFIVPKGKLVLPKEDPHIFINFEDEEDTINYLGEFYIFKDGKFIKEEE